MTRGKHDGPPLSRELVQALRGDAPDSRDVERAYRRFALHRDVARRPLRAARWAAAGFVMGWGVVFAATGEPFPGYRALRQPNTVEPSAPKREIPQRPTPPAPVLPSDAFEAPSAPASVRSPPAVSFPLDEGAPDPKWQRVARALREHDYAEAQTALDELERSSDRSDAEAASLALAQVHVARGRGRDVRPRLEHLVASARSSLVRDKARALLGEIDAEDRSSAVPMETKVP